MGWESFDVVRFDLGPSRSNDGSLALNCLSGGYKFALVLRCIGLVIVEYSQLIKVTCTMVFGSHRF